MSFAFPCFELIEVAGRCFFVLGMGMGGWWLRGLVDFGLMFRKVDFGTTYSG